MNVFKMLMWEMNSENDNFFIACRITLKGRFPSGVFLNPVLGSVLHLHFIRDRIFTLSLSIKSSPTTRSNVIKFSCVFHRRIFLHALSLCRHCWYYDVINSSLRYHQWNYHPPDVIYVTTSLRTLWRHEHDVIMVWVWWRHNFYGYYGVIISMVIMTS